MLFAHDAFSTLGYGFDVIDALATMGFNWLTVPITSAVVACVRQVFYAYRIFVLSKSRAVPAFIICVSLTTSVAAIIMGIYCPQKTSIAVGIWCGGSALCDIVIAICMTYYLMGRNTAFRRTQILVTKLIRLTIETGSMTAVVALATLILFCVFPEQTFYTVPALLIPKLYANSVYMVLNSRIRIIGGRDAYTSTDMSITTTMIRDMTFEGTQPMDGMHCQVLVVAINEEDSDDGHEMGRTKISHGDSIGLSV
ncbi:hypothetical protein IW262DRAFT_1457833 [Armillaria fumosa]|nr:hypothetical protein IW262DRAFT_1457833 [Armillaria fumosa]